MTTARVTPLTGPDAATRFRRAAGHLPTGASVVTALDRHDPFGMTVGSLTCASYDPPMIIFFAQRGSRTASVIEASGWFGVNVLGRGAEAQCYRFASSAPDRFDDIELCESLSGMPRLRRAVLWMDCRLDSVVTAGDHLGFLGRVQDYDATSCREQPLVYCKSRIAPLNAGSGRHLPAESLTWWGEL